MPKPTTGLPVLAMPSTTRLVQPSSMPITTTAATFGFSMDAEARRRLPRIVLAALLMGGTLWLAVQLLPTMAGAHTILQAARLAILIAFGIAVYGICLLSFRVIDWRSMRTALMRSGDLRP